MTTVKGTSCYGEEGLGLLAKEGLLKVLHKKASKTHDLIDADWEDMDNDATSIIGLCMAYEVMINVIDETSTTRLWLKLESLYMMKSLSNKLYLKKQLYSLCMKEDTPVLEHMNIFNKIVNDLLCLEVKLEEDKALLPLVSLHHHMTT